MYQNPACEVTFTDAVELFRYKSQYVPPGYGDALIVPLVKWSLSKKLIVPNPNVVLCPFCQFVNAALSQIKMRKPLELVEVILKSPVTWQVDVWWRCKVTGHV